jgi:hypothetical protein
LVFSGPFQWVNWLAEQQEAGPPPKPKKKKKQQSNSRIEQFLDELDDDDAWNQYIVKKIDSRVAEANKKSKKPQPKGQKVTQAAVSP